MKNPLNKRIPREFAGDWRKYFVIIIFMALMISCVSGIYVSNDSMLEALHKGPKLYKLEDGNFELNKEADSGLISKIEAGEEKVKIYEHFFRNSKEDNDSDGKSDATCRVFKSTAEIDQASFLSGRAPENENEVAIDRMHADNAGIKLNDTIKIDGEKFKVVGLISYVNYVVLFEKNTDLMFDAITFDVAMVTDEGFDRLNSRVHYSYAWQYEDKPSTDIEKAEASSDFMKALMTELTVSGYNVQLNDYLPAYLNQAINYAETDMKGDVALIAIMAYILIAVIAFIFAVTISSTIDKEATVIGTLRASGYTKGELIKHFMAIPVIVTIIGAVLGNLLGYTVFKTVFADMYYNSYSLPAYKTIWNTSALIKTTVIPLVLMFFINLFVIVRKLELSPLQFLRHDLKKQRNKKAMRLPSVSFLNRYRMRVLFRNIPNYLILAFGILFAEIMLCFAVGFLGSVNHFTETASEMRLSNYQYFLTSSKDKSGELISTEEKSAEKFNSKSLYYAYGSRNEDTRAYGTEDGSAYVKFKELKKGEVEISSAFSKKFGLSEGDKITLDEKYEDKSYDFSIKGIIDDDSEIAVFMPIDRFNNAFDFDDDAFNGYFSQKKIKDIDEDYIATVLTEKDITKVARQLNHSVGQALLIFEYVIFVLSAVLIYLLTKLIIEKDEPAISMNKILGFFNKEIGSLYMLPTAWMVVLFTIVGFFISSEIIKLLFKAYMFTIDSYFEYYMSVPNAIKCMLFVLIAYAVVTLIDYRRIKRIPLSVALKNME